MSEIQDPTPAEPTGGLTETERAVLDLEEGWWKYAGVKETTIREKFGWSATRYYQVLNRLLDRPEALAYAPLTVKRLRRIRDARQAQRSARRLGL
jgi:hypothetical protein